MNLSNDILHNGNQDEREKLYWNAYIVKLVKLGKLILGAMIIFGLLFPDFIWGGDTVTVTDENGRDITDELSGQDIYEGIYTTENLEFSFSWLN